MPFLGKDWRSSGDEWVRTELGWERTKVLECILDNLNTGLQSNKASRLNLDQDETDGLKESVSTMSDDEEDDLDEFGLFTEEDNLNNQTDNENDDILKKKPNRFSFSKLSISTSSIDNRSYKARQPHIIYFNINNTIRENKFPKASVSEVLNALDMPGAVKDTKRFNYVCRLVQLIINTKLNELSGNAQRTLFLIVKQMLLQVMKTQENLNVMRKLLFDFKKKIQDSYYYYFYYIGSQKLCEKHLATINKWQQMLENPNSFKKVKRLNSAHLIKKPSANDANNDDNKENNTTKIGFENIPFDCKLEIMRRLNTGLDLVNLSKCSRNLNDIISKELAIWKNLCQFHFQQTNINSLLNKQLRSKNKSSESGDSNSEVSSDPVDNDLDWKLIYFRLKRRYGHREVYVDMIHKCFHCKSLFWKEIGHPCIIAENMSDQLELRTEPITPLKLVELLLK